MCVGEGGSECVFCVRVACVLRACCVRVCVDNGSY